MKSTFRNSKAFHAATLMPRGMAHYPDKSEGFNIFQSEAVEWVLNQPEIAKYLFNKIRETGAIKFDQATQTWGGINADSDHE